MKVLITGGLGFVGTHLTRLLRNRGHDVFTLDLLPSPDPRHFRADIRSYRSLRGILEKGFDLVYHLAAEAGRWNGEDHYEALWTTNVIGTKHLIRVQEALRFRLVYLSSSEVYGDYAGTMKEEVTERIPFHLLNDYAMTKWVGEEQILNSERMSGTESVRIRMFNLYGPGERFAPGRGVVARFIWHAMQGLPYTVYSAHRRTSTYIDDAVRTLGALTDRFRPGRVYNIGGFEEHDMKRVSDIILKHLGLDDSLVRYEEREAFTTLVKSVDCTRAVDELGHRIEIDLEEGLARTVRWAIDAYGAPRLRPSVSHAPSRNLGDP